MASITHSKRFLPATAGICLSLSIAPFLQAEPFSFDQLCEQARQLAKQPYTPAKQDLHDFWKSLTYDQHRDIRFKMDQGLWAKEQLPFSIDFFHPGWTAKKMVDIHETHNGQEQTLKFDRSLFDYGKQTVPDQTPSPQGYAGWRARCHLNTNDYMDEFLVFLGASYLRAIPAHSPYGLSARGLSINSGLPGVPEEFPDFTKFYLERPTKDSKTMKVCALLEGESVAGAYQFSVTPGTETEIDVEAEITLRRPVQQLGLVPFSSMFWFGESTNPKPLDFRPEVHDSDGVLMELDSGNLHYRPLEHTHGKFRHCVFTMEKPRSWSLLQRDRAFSSYQDPEARYNERPSVKIQPISGFDQGKIHLIEMPTRDETEDNVILLWEPPTLEVGKPFRFHYKMHWLRDLPASGKFAVKATRIGTPVQKPNQILISVDFAKPLTPSQKVANESWDDIKKLKPVVTLNQKEAKLLHVGLSDVSMPFVDDLPLGMGRDPKVHMPQILRAFFVIDPDTNLENIDMTCELLNEKGEVASERWIYLWKKPAP